MKRYHIPKKDSSKSMKKKIYSSTERVIDNIPCPPLHLLTIKDIFGNSG